MVEPVIACSHCHKEIKLTESLAAPLIEATRQEFEHKLASKDTEVARREAAVRDEERKLTEAQRDIDKQVAERIHIEREAIAAEEANKARLLISDELDGKNSEPAELQEVLESKDGKLADAQKAQAELIRKQREFDDAMREFDLTVETRIRESLGNVRIKAKREVEDELKLKIAEREETIAGMQRQIEVPKQKDEQGSRQAQGEAQELALESLLATCFLHRPRHA